MNYRAGENPAIALYRYWLSVIQATNPPHEQDRCVPFLVDGHGIWILGKDWRGRPILAFGQTRGYERSGWSLFEVTAEGHFRISANMHGAHRRNVVRHATFLSWGYRASRYQWYVDTANVYKPLWSWSHDSFKDWANPLRYYSEDLLGCRTWGQTYAWMALERWREGWRMVPTRRQEMFHGSRLDRRAMRRYAALKQRFDDYERLTERRYLKHENIHRENIGLDPKRSARPVTVRAGGQVLTQDEAVKRIVALLNPATPAITPLPRPKEATHGDHHLAPAHQL